MRRARVLIADPLPLFRNGVRNLLRRESDLEVIEASNADDAATLLAGGHAEIALIDLALPPTGGIDLVRRVRSRTRAAMIVWSLEPSRDAVLESITAGAHGFLHKEISPIGLVRALRGAVNGEAPLSRDMAALMIDAIHTLEERSKARERAAVLVGSREGSARVRRPRRTKPRDRRRAGDLGVHGQAAHAEHPPEAGRAVSARGRRLLRLRVPRRSSRRGEVGMSERETPLVAVICAVPLLGEAVTGALEGLAECKFIPARQPELGGLLKSLQPDAIVVDDEQEGAVAATYARFARVPVILISLRENTVQLLDEGRWVYPEESGASAESIRNLVAGGIYGRRSLR